MLLDRAIQFGDISGGMVVVMQLHGGFVDVGLECGVIVGQWWNFVSQSVSSSVRDDGWAGYAAGNTTGHCHVRLRITGSTEGWETNRQANSVYTSMDAEWGRGVPPGADEAATEARLCES